MPRISPLWLFPFVVFGVLYGRQHLFLSAPATLEEPPTVSQTPPESENQVEGIPTELLQRVRSIPGYVTVANLDGVRFKDLRGQARHARFGATCRLAQESLVTPLGRLEDGRQVLEYNLSDYEAGRLFDFECPRGTRFAITQKQYRAVLDNVAEVTKQTAIKEAENAALAEQMQKFEAR